MENKKTELERAYEKIFSSSLDEIDKNLDILLRAKHNESNLNFEHKK